MKPGVYLGLIETGTAFLCIGASSGRPHFAIFSEPRPTLHKDVELTVIATAVAPSYAEAHAMFMPMVENLLSRF